MPASLFHESESSLSTQLTSNLNHLSGSLGCGSGSLEDQRALQLALELSMLGLSNETDPLSSFDPDSRGKKSQNTTECVPVPSSEHVAEIVGRQGCKIKALRAKTNTYIKTPVRGEEPVFVVTGRKEDVASAKREILSAAEHFSQIRAQRKSNLSGGGGLVPGMGSGGLGISNAPNPNIPGQTTIQVRVPYRVVGLVVGPKGATIKRIQQQTNTYIITPSRDKEPIFEVTGLPESVETAKKEIEAHIATRTGGFIGDTGIPINGAPGSERDRDSFRDRDHFSSGFHARSTSPLFKSDAFGSFSSRIVGDNNSNNNNSSSNALFNSRSSAHDIFNFGSKFSDLYSFGTSSSTFGNNNNNNHHSSTSGSTTTGFGIYESADEGLGDSPTFTESLVASTNSSSSATSSGSSSAWPDFGSKAFASVNSSLSLLERRGSASLGSENSTASSSSCNGVTANSPTAESGDSCGVVGGEVSSGRRLSTDAMTSAFVNAVTSAALGFSALSGSTTTSSSPTESLTSLGSMTSGGVVGAGSIGGGRKASTKRDCIVCFEGEIQAALIPCGHNLFCMDCALSVCRKSDPSCPVCRQQASQAIRIIS